MLLAWGCSKRIRDMSEKKILAIVGSYRRGGVIDSVIDAMVEKCTALGHKAEKIYLVDQNIEFCTNCRGCMQEECAFPVHCVHFSDDMEVITTKVLKADGVIIGCPVNVGSSNALTQRFVERFAGFFYWPWGTRGGPRPRLAGKSRRAVILSSSTAPAIMNSLPFGFNAMHTLKFFCLAIGARVVASLKVGLITDREITLSKRTLAKANRAAVRLCE